MATSTHKPCPRVPSERLRSRPSEAPARLRASAWRYSSASSTTISFQRSLSPSSGLSESSPADAQKRTIEQVSVSCRP
jgi:hypothetical protein